MKDSTTTAQLRLPLRPAPAWREFPVRSITDLIAERRTTEAISASRSSGKEQP